MRDKVQGETHIGVRTSERVNMSMNMNMNASMSMSGSMGQFIQSMCRHTTYCILYAQAMSECVLADFTAVVWNWPTLEAHFFFFLWEPESDLDRITNLVPNFPRTARGFYVFFLVITNSITFV
ncbi:hypothetical protein J3Q64DRAFT_1703957 [Phycomyces blakesleeanus]|uniref:Uncharacterized protein n=2 Tax=Phycomyces blakesleeanus TaxID=4837 RepID=A0A167JPJ5_PHYB8|nr:hypothetical protein PHYBLDRAFT_175257 [Phycomyces blakesleeanus NRRL 1555(-)]OAD66446.1 hypothetical protein PHYBLDRAFT_175257 [Phycomyces blakesleeanus NRRL 1555(-)]|eukprot:XP_018284486.1 hypothetical protein PHYBLDRAFT_175257 [Phycomyces blakesleeanus NRRL 1555(-)]